MDGTAYANTHIPVLVNEVLAHLELRDGLIVFDGTLNAGGHARLIAERIAQKGTIIGVDRDERALAAARENLANAPCRVIIRRADYRNIVVVLEDVGVSHVDRILLDIGLSSTQLERSGRGFSFRKDEPLLMTFEAEPQKTSFTAQTIVNEWDENHIADILFGYGNERYARRIARAIVRARQESPILTTGALVRVIERAVPPRYRFGAISPATRTFQALRIAVNDEFGALREGIMEGFRALVPGGLFAIITFHSGEDRIVKRLFRELVTEGAAQAVTKKPIVPSAAEVAQNPRSRSAKMRLIRKLRDREYVNSQKEN